jgi:hypothetical protein
MLGDPAPARSEWDVAPRVTDRRAERRIYEAVSPEQDLEARLHCFLRVTALLRCRIVAAAAAVLSVSMQMREKRHGRKDSRRLRGILDRN